MYRPRIIIDIRFNDGTYTRGIVAHSMEFEPDLHWALKIYLSQTDVFNDNPRLYWGVDRVEVVGYLEKEEK